MKPPMYHTAYKNTSTRNEYGDYVAGADVAVICHWLDKTKLVADSNEQVQSDAMAWFEPDSGIVKGDIIKFEGVHYKVIAIESGRALRNPAVTFLECKLAKFGAIS